MSTPESTAPLDSARLAEIEDRSSRAGAEIDRLTSAPGGPGASWRWSIPAQPERDSDLILNDSLVDVPVLLAEVERLTEALVAEQARLRRVEALADQEDEAVASGFSRLFNGALPMAFVSVPSLRAALAGNTEGAEQ